jgi:hypothetical protein
MTSSYLTDLFVNFGREGALYNEIVLVVFDSNCVERRCIGLARVPYSRGRSPKYALRQQSRDDDLARVGS